MKHFLHTGGIDGLISRYTVPEDAVRSYRINLLLTSISAVAFHGMHIKAVAILYDSHMVCISVGLPVEVNNVAWRRNIIPILPLSTSLEPVDSVIHQGMLWNDLSLDIAALIGAP